MGKKIKFESFIYLILQHFTFQRELTKNTKENQWRFFLQSLDFKYKGKEVSIAWTYPKKGNININLSRFQFYYRGDCSSSINKQENERLIFNEDVVAKRNSIEASIIINHIMKEIKFY